MHSKTAIRYGAIRLLLKLVAKLEGNPSPQPDRHGVVRLCNKPNAYHRRRREDFCRKPFYLDVWPEFKNPYVSKVILSWDMAEQRASILAAKRNALNADTTSGASYSGVKSG